MPKIIATSALAGALLAASSVAAFQPQGSQTPPLVPKPFPQPTTPPGGATPPSTSPGTPSSTTPTRMPTPHTARPDAPSEAQLGVPVYPSAEFLGSVDAGKGQRYYLFGTNTPYPDILLYYKSVLKSNGRELFKTPAMQQFDLGKFSEDTMAYPPSVVVKDYTWNGSEGYLYIDGTMEKRFHTVIQIVPAAAR